MSGVSASPLSDAERTDVRRFCGYPAYGSGQTGFESWRFFQAYGSLEYRMTNLSGSEVSVVRSYLAQLNTLETALVGSGQNLDTDQAAVWRHNRNEVGDRSALLAAWSLRLCRFLGVPLGAGLQNQAEVKI